MSTLTEVAEALAARARTISGVTAKPYVPGSSEWPAVFVQPVTVEYEGLDLVDEDMRVELVVMVGAVTPESQMRLFRFMEHEGTYSIPGKVREDRTLGLGDVDALVVRARALGQQEQAAYQGYGCAFEVVIRL